MADRRLIFLLNVAQRRLQRHLATQGPKGGVTPSQSGLLFVLGKRDGVLMSEAGAALDLGMPGISGLADRMVEAGLIARRSDPISSGFAAAGRRISILQLITALPASLNHR